MKDSVEKMMQSPGGRERLAKERKKFEYESLQPSDPRFKRVYGDKIKRTEEEKRKQEDKSKGEWEEDKEKREREKGSIERKRLQL